MSSFLRITSALALYLAGVEAIDMRTLVEQPLVEATSCAQEWSLSTTSAKQALDKGFKPYTIVTDKGDYTFQFFSIGEDSIRVELSFPNIDTWLGLAWGNTMVGSDINWAFNNSSVTDGATVEDAYSTADQTPSKDTEQDLLYVVQEVVGETVYIAYTRLLDTGDTEHGAADDFVIPLDEEITFAHAYNSDTNAKEYHTQRETDKVMTVKSDCTPAYADVDPDFIDCSTVWKNTGVDQAKGKGYNPFVFYAPQTKEATDFTFNFFKNSRETIRVEFTFPNTSPCWVGVAWGNTMVGSDFNWIFNSNVNGDKTDVTVEDAYSHEDASPIKDAQNDLTDISIEVNKETKITSVAYTRKIDTGDVANGNAQDFVIPEDSEIAYAWAYNSVTNDRTQRHTMHTPDAKATLHSQCTTAYDEKVDDAAINGLVSSFAAIAAALALAF